MKEKLIKMLFMVVKGIAWIVGLVGGCLLGKWVVDLMFGK